MPGIFGGLGLTPEEQRELIRLHRSRWKDCVAVKKGSLLVGGAASGSNDPVIETPSGWMAIDGGTAAYTVYGDSESGEPSSGWQDGAHVPEVPATLASANWSAGEICLAADWSGAFPLYWHKSQKAFAFSSHPGPLAAQFQPDVDRVGLLSFLKDAFYVGDRSCLGEIRRIQAGQVVRYVAHNHRLSVTEHSRGWSAQLRDEIDKTEHRDKLWSAITTSIEGALRGTDRVALMLSGGWDSRTLLAAARSTFPGELMGLSHGDTGSRELRIVERLCGAVDIDCVLRSIRSTEFSPDVLRDVYRRSGTAQFPYWAVSGGRLDEAGVEAVATGVYGEVLGGHYGPGMTMTGLSKVGWLIGRLLSRATGFGWGRRIGASIQLDDVRHLLLSGVRGAAHYLSSDFLQDESRLFSALAADIDRAVERLTNRGVEGSIPLMEAYLTENRGGQFINGQTRSARTQVPVCLPFAHRRSLSLASSISFDERIHNTLNRAILLKEAPGLLDSPLAATLVAASAPIEVQELSRAFRKIWEKSRWWLHHQTKGMVSPPQLSWINYEHLHGTDVLQAVADDMHWEGWDMTSVRAVAERVRQGRWSGSLHVPINQFLKMYTLELTLRSRTL